LYVKFGDPIAASVFEISSEKKQQNSGVNPIHSAAVGAWIISFFAKYINAKMVNCK